jgi:hypothetical protein
MSNINGSIINKGPCRTLVEATKETQCFRHLLGEMGVIT